MIRSSGFYLPAERFSESKILCVVYPILKSSPFVIYFSKRVNRSIKKVRLFVVLVLMLNLMFTCFVRAGFLYAITFDEELLSINPATGAGTLVGMLDTSMNGLGLSSRGHKIYTFDQNADRLRRLDPATGQTLRTIDIGIITMGEGSIAFRGDGIGFMTRSMSSTGILWSFDPEIPSSTLVGAMDICFDGLGFNADGLLYGISQTSCDLYIIDQTNADVTLIGSTGITSQTFLGGLTFSSDGTLYAVLNDALYTLNPDTGTANLIGPIGYDNVSGLTATAPVPGAVLLCGLGVVLVNWLRRCKKL
jgi:hypothetical protein